MRDTYIKVLVPAGTSYLRARRPIALEELGRLAVLLGSLESSTISSPDSVARFFHLGVKDILIEEEYDLAGEDFNELANESSFLELDLRSDNLMFCWVTLKMRVPWISSKPVVLSGNMQTLADAMKANIKKGIMNEVEFINSVSKFWTLRLE